MRILDKIIEAEYRLPGKLYQKKWLIDLGQDLKELDQIKEVSMMCQCKILYWVRHHWDSIGSEIKGFWDYDYYKWASSFTQNESINNPASSTIDNKVGVYRDYIAEKNIEVPASVKVRKVDNSGQLTEEYEEIAPNLMQGNYTKLLHARKPAKEGNMTDDLWSIVFDPSQSVNTFLKEVKKIPSVDCRIVERDGLIIAETQNGSSILAEINFDDTGNPVWLEGISKLLKSYAHTLELL